MELSKLRETPIVNGKHRPPSKKTSNVSIFQSEKCFPFAAVINDDRKRIHSMFSERQLIFSGHFRSFPVFNEVYQAPLRIHVLYLNTVIKLRITQYTTPVVATKYGSVCSVSKPENEL